MNGSGVLHAYQVTPLDAACIQMMAGARFAPDAEVILPSGRKISGAEMTRWVGKSYEEAPGTGAG